MIVGLLGLAACGAPASPPVAGTIGAFPFCEPSALIPLGSGPDAPLLVGDNEGRPADPAQGEPEIPTLSVLPMAGGRPGAPIPVPRAEARADVESLVRLGDELWVVGSFSRNSACVDKPERSTIAVYRPTSWTPVPALGDPVRKLALAPDLLDDAKRCEGELFTGPSEAASRVCAALARARADADAARAADPGRDKLKHACGTLNVEGSAALGDRVWLGLRAPLVDGRAVLLRLAPKGDGIAFDRVAFVETGGRGIRELVAQDARLFGIAGAPTDPVPGGSARSALFVVPQSALDVDGAVVRATVLDDGLPTNAESVRLLPNEALYLLDGTMEHSRCPSVQWIARPRPADPIGPAGQ